VSTFFDLSPLSLPRYGSERSLRKTLKRFAHAARTADRIIAISGATKNDFLHYFDYPEQNVVVTHLGVSPAFLSRAAPTRSRNAADAARPYLSRSAVTRVRTESHHHGLRPLLVTQTAGRVLGSRRAGSRGRAAVAPRGSRSRARRPR
jgi:hypothetical protein